MNDRDLSQFRQKLRASLPPLPEPELRRDLWPAMRARMRAPLLRVPWYDWLLLAAAGAAACLFPALIPALLYHL